MLRIEGELTISVLEEEFTILFLLLVKVLQMTKIPVFVKNGSQKIAGQRGNQLITVFLFKYKKIVESFFF